MNDLSVLFQEGRRAKDPTQSYDRVATAREEVAKVLGLSLTRVNELLRISGWDEKLKEPIRQQKIAGRTAAAAHRIGGAEAIDAAAKNEIGFRAMMDITWLCDPFGTCNAFDRPATHSENRHSNTRHTGAQGLPVVWQLDGSPRTLAVKL